MTRHSRRFLQRSLVLVVLSLLVGCGIMPLPGQQATKVRAIGYLSSRASPPTDPTRMGFDAGMRELGYIEGENLIVEHRFGQLDPAQLRAGAEELAQLRVDAIFASGEPAAQAALEATQDIPIVMTV